MTTRSNAPETREPPLESLDSSPVPQQMLLFEPTETPMPFGRTTTSTGQRSSSTPLSKSKRNTPPTFTTIVTVNDKGRTIGEDHANARYLDSDVEKARELRKYGYTYQQISTILDMPIRTIRDYISGRRRCQSVAGWKRVKRRRRDA